MINYHIFLPTESKEQETSLGEKNWRSPKEQETPPGEIGTVEIDSPNYPLFIST